MSRWRKHLRGGSGGGGGGARLHTTRVNGLPLMCGSPIPPQTLKISSWFDHSGAGGGGGGGAVQANARRLQIDGQLVLGGGEGGSSLGTPDFGQFLPNNNSAAPGGGGAGGAFLGQARELVIADQPERIDVRGGLGGDQNDANLSFGGDGGHGLVRLESLPGALQIQDESFKVAPYEGRPFSTAVLSVGTVVPKSTGPAAYSGSQSCWIQPQGNFFELEFKQDDFSDPLNPMPGWDLDVVLPGGLSLPLRDDNGVFGFTIEQLIGTDLMGNNASPLVVRFQGVHALGALANPCEVDLSDDSVEILTGSRTAWVRHPAELNGYFDHLGPVEAAKRRVNAIRFQVIFDDTSNLYPGVVLGVTNLSIEAVPD